MARRTSRKVGGTLHAGSRGPSAPSPTGKTRRSGQQPSPHVSVRTGPGDGCSTAGGPDGSRQIESRVADRSEMGCHVLPFDSLRSLTRSIRNAHSGCPERSRRAGHSTRPKCVAEGHERAHREAGESNGGGGGTRTHKGLA